MTMTARDPWIRFWPKVDAGGDCWEWQGAVRQDGYGAFWFKGQMTTAHRVAYELLMGPIPLGLQIDHLCKNRQCVNPDHLEPVTAELNRRRGEYGKAAQAAQREKTHCPQGHPYSGANLYSDSSGKRQCRTCKNEWQRKKRGATIRYEKDAQPHFEVTVTEVTA
ncbi:HNH endonuclease signature motif containing protein [Leifsonia sp. NPDC058194]|uniref:HNH endonuclease signature motif containing protein n=1 Tax=Leifsonia sp. NPDC058194 TaxID=3346374 RepID=UPI0036DCC2C4